MAVAPIVQSELVTVIKFNDIQTEYTECVYGW